MVGIMVIIYIEEGSKWFLDIYSGVFEFKIYFIKNIFNCDLFEDF